MIAVVPADLVAVRIDVVVLERRHVHLASEPDEVHHRVGFVVAGAGAVVALVLDVLNIPVGAELVRDTRARAQCRRGPGEHVVRDQPVDILSGEGETEVRAIVRALRRRVGRDRLPVLEEARDVVRMRDPGPHFRAHRRRVAELRARRAVELRTPALVDAIVHARVVAVDVREATGRIIEVGRARALLEVALSLVPRIADVTEEALPPRVLVLWQLERAVERHVRARGDVEAAGASAILRRDDDGAVRRARTVERRRVRPLEDGDRGDVVWIQVLGRVAHVEAAVAPLLRATREVGVVDRDAVDHEQWLIVAADRRRAANNDAGRTTLRG